MRAESAPNSSEKPTFVSCDEDTGVETYEYADGRQVTVMPEILEDGGRAYSSEDTMRLLGFSEGQITEVSANWKSN
jgi:hypothetical protein